MQHSGDASELQLIDKGPSGMRMLYSSANHLDTH